MNTIELYQHYPELQSCREKIECARELLLSTYRNGGKVLLCGNGGSCSDCDHIVGELMKSFLLPRPIDDGLRKKLCAVDPAMGTHLADSLQVGLPAISLHSQSALLSAFCNDVASDTVYAQTLLGYAKREDLLFCISTSGNSENVVYAAVTAKALGLRIISLTGEKESKLSSLSDVTVRVPATDTYRVQEYHLPIYHYLCAESEAAFF